MSSQEEEFLNSLRATFRVEAEEHLQKIAAGLLELEKSTAPEDRKRLIETVFRAAHSLKGAARPVNFRDIESICQSVEDTLAAWRREESVPTPQSLEATHRHLDAMTRIMAGNPSEEEGPTGAAPVSPARTPVSEVTTLERSPSGDTVRIAVAKLDARLLEAEEMIVAKLAAKQRAADLR